MLSTQKHGVNFTVQTAHCPQRQNLRTASSDHIHTKRTENPETYLYDGRGSVVQLLQGGTVSQSYSYNAYGYINTDEYGIQAPFYGYNGEQHDPATGLQYLRARYYAPQNGGFISQDSFAGLLTDALSQNQYTYVQNNPVNYIDPTGHVAKAVQPVAKTNSSGTGKITAPAVTKTVQSSQTKKTVTATPTASTLSSVSTYTSGAAKAAQTAKIPNASGKLAASTVGNVLLNSYRPLQRNDPDPKPNWFENTIDAIKSFGRKICDSTAKHFEMQLELEQAEMQAIMAVRNKLAMIEYQQQMMELEVKESEFHFIFSGIVLVGAHVLGRQSVPKEVSDANYEINSGLDAENKANQIIGPGIYINGQGLKNFPQYQFGNGSNFEAQGCLPFSIYDANIRLGDYENLADIQYGIETNNYTAKFNSGSVATYIPKYFGDKGYEVYLNLAPTPEELEWMAQEYDTVIITHYNSTDFRDGSHYMNLYYDDETNQYVVNNWMNSQSYPETLLNVDKLYGEGINRVYYAYGISKGEQ